MRHFVKHSFNIFIVISLATEVLQAQNAPTSANVPPGTPATFIMPKAFNVSPNSTPSAYNYSRVWAPTAPITDENSSQFSLGSSNTIPVATQYTDGFSRKIMTITHAPDNSHKNIITPVDNRASLTKFGFMPYARPNVMPRFSDNLSPFSSDIAYYYGQYVPEGHTGLSESVTSFPSGVPTVTTYSPGSSFVGQNRGTVVTSGFNVVNDVVNYSYSAGTVSGFGTYYAANTLVLKTTTTQNGGITKEYTNNDNQLVCKKVTSGNDKLGNPIWLVTNYIYDDLGRIVCVLTPKASTFSSFSSQMMSYCFTYLYNKYGKVVERTLPDKTGKEYTVYDSRNRPVLFQSPLMATQGLWQFSIYDNRDHVMMSGILIDANSRANWQTWVYGGTTPTPPSTVTSLLSYLTNGFTGTYPSSITSCEIRQYNYYDTYDGDPSFSGRTFDNSNSSDYLTYGNAVIPVPYGFPHGQLTASRTKVIDSTGAGGFTNSWITSVYFYDQKGRLIQTQTKNPWNTYYWDETTLQYNFIGQKIQDFTHHYACGACSEGDTKLLTRYIYDPYYGRLTGVQEQIDNNSLRNIATYTYDDLGKVKSKNLGGVEQQDYTYNIRGQLSSINKGIFSSPDPDKTFGLQLSYDYGFTEPRYDGSISGIQWKGAGSEPIGSYGYEYDAAGRLTNANYNQAVLGGWSKSSTDYTMSNVAYDVNGNILSMKQMGTPGPGYSSVPVPIDELTYTYTGTGNQLQRVQDAIKVDYHLGDFQDITGTVDYTYDADGNLASDYNKQITGITYNEQDLPLSVTFYNGSTIKNLYDASGNLLWKQVYNSVTGHTDVYHYWGGFNYRNDSLLFVLTEEGRARWLPDSNTFKYDFFVKDHLGNVRTVVTSDESSMVNYFADHELAAAGLESSMFANLNAVRDYKPGSPNPYDVMAAHLDGSDPSRRIGTAIAMSVMAGDKFDISATSYFNSDSVNMQSAVAPNNMMNSIISSLVGGVDGYNQEATNVNAVNAMYSSGNYLGMYQGILDSISDYTRPLAYINYLVFDNQMNLIPSQSGAIQISGTPNNWQVIGTSGPITIGQNGYLSVYMSNSDYMPVYMDKLHITYYKGRLVQEQHYYPFGLSINEATAPGITNQYQYQDKKLQDELGLNLYDFHARQYDAQIGRFWGVDPADQFPSGYTGQGNDPANNIDPTGMAATGGDFGYSARSMFTDWESGASQYNKSNTLLDGDLAIDMVGVGFSVNWSTGELAYTDVDGTKTEYDNSISNAGIGAVGGSDGDGDGNNNPNTTTATGVGLTMAAVDRTATVSDDQKGIIRASTKAYYDYNMVDAFINDVLFNVEKAMGLDQIDNYIADVRQGGMSGNAYFMATVNLMMSGMSMDGVEVESMPLYTRSNLKMGQQMHAEYFKGQPGKEFRLPSGRRIDYLDIENETIYELKPNNPRAIKQGQQQLQNYQRELESMPRFQQIKWKTVLDTY